MWCGKYLCGCGRGMVRKMAGRGEAVFLCYWQHVNGRGREEVRMCAEREEAEGNRETKGCQLKPVAEWQLEMIAYLVIRAQWDSREADLEQAWRVTEECLQGRDGSSSQERELRRRRREQLEKRKESLVDMRADGEITKEEYAIKRQEYEEELRTLKEELLSERENGEMAEQDGGKFQSIRQALCQLIDFSGPKLNREIVDGWIRKLVHSSDYEFQVFLWKDGWRRSGTWKHPDTDKDTGIGMVQKTIVITYEDARKYRAMSGKRVMRSRWEDLTVYIYEG